MIRLLVFVIILAAVIFIAYQIFTFFIAVNNTRSQKKRDVGAMREELSTTIDSLISLSDEELELLSINVEQLSKRPGINPVVTGVFTSIYHEPLIAFGQKSYGPSGQEVFTAIYTSEHEFVYQTKGDQTTVNVDGQMIGTIHSDGNLYDMKERQVAHIEADDVLATHPVKVGSREVGEIVNPRLASSPNPRAYTFLEPMDIDEKVLFMSLTLLSLVEETVG